MSPHVRQDTAPAFPVARALRGPPRTAPCLVRLVLFSAMQLLMPLILFSPGAHAHSPPRRWCSAGPAGLEPATVSFGDWCSRQLSYVPMWYSVVPTRKAARNLFVSFAAAPRLSVVSRQPGNPCLRNGHAEPEARSSCVPSGWMVIMLILGIIHHPARGVQLVLVFGSEPVGDDQRGDQHGQPAEDPEGNPQPVAVRVVDEP